MTYMEGTRITSYKLPVRNEAGIRYFPVRLVYEQLHPTKGWRKVGPPRFVDVSPAQYREAPIKGFYWMPNQQKPPRRMIEPSDSGRLMRGRRPLNLPEAPHTHPRRLR